MGLTFTSVTISSNPMNAPCPGGAFSVKVEVNGTADAAGGRYNVDLRDDDPFLNPDDLLDRVTGVIVAPGKPFKDTHMFKLICDGKCDVAGQLGTSGEQAAEVFAVAIEQNPAQPNQLASQQITLTCEPVQDGRRRG